MYCTVISKLRNWDQEIIFIFTLWPSFVKVYIFSGSHEISLHFIYYYLIGQWRSGWKYKRHCYQKSWWQETQLWCGCWADRKSIWCSKGHNKKGWDFVRKLFSWNSLQWKLWNCKRFVNQIKALLICSHFIKFVCFFSAII